MCAKSPDLEPGDLGSMPDSGAEAVWPWAGSLTSLVMLPHSTSSTHQGYAEHSVKWTIEKGMARSLTQEIFLRTVSFRLCVQRPGL